MLFIGEIAESKNRPAITLITLKLIFFDPVNRGFLATRSIQFAIL
jgi:hypothetical protein